MNAHCQANLKLRVLFAVVLLSWIRQGAAVMAGTIPRVYVDAFRAIHDGGDPEWKGMKGVEAWFQAERALIENQVLEWLRADRGTREWDRGLFLGRKIGSGAICSVVFNLVRDDLARD